MKNSWKEIPLTDYENHMKLESVMQLQTLNEMMKGQFDAYPIFRVMILGIAGGNGLMYHSRQCLKLSTAQSIPWSVFCQMGKINTNRFSVPMRFSNPPRFSFQFHSETNIV